MKKKIVSISLQLNFSLACHIFFFFYYIVYTLYYQRETVTIREKSTRERERCCWQLTQDPPRGWGRGGISQRVQSSYIKTNFINIRAHVCVCVCYALASVQHRRGLSLLCHFLLHIQERSRESSSFMRHSLTLSRARLSPRNEYTHTLIAGVCVCVCVFLLHVRIPIHEEYNNK